MTKPRLSKLHSLNLFLTARLDAAAVDILGAVEKTITDYQEEIYRSKEENDRLRQLLIDFGFKPDRQSLITVGEQFIVPVTADDNAAEPEGCEPENTECLCIPQCVDSDQCSYLYQAVKNRKKESQSNHAAEHIQTKHGGQDNAASASESTSDTQTLSKPRSKQKQAKNGPCPPDTGTVSGLSAPMRTPTGDRPHKCLVCRKGFNNKNHLKTHQRIHTGERPHWCKECGKCFNRKGDLATHMRTHTGEKPYQCSICGKSFRRNRLNEHMRVHTGEKPYHCTDCEKGYKTVSDLKRHQRIHTGEKPFRCNNCGKCFNQMTTLKKHMRTVHKVLKLQSSEHSSDL